jgi:hypothetical protein
MFDELHGRLVLLESRMAELPALFKTMEMTFLSNVQSMLEPQQSIPERLRHLADAALPERLRKLEAKVYAPKRRASKAGRQRS